MEFAHACRADQKSLALLVESGILDAAGNVVDPSKAWGRVVSRTMTDL